MRELRIGAGDYDRTAAFMDHMVPLDDAPYCFVALDAPPRTVQELRELEDLDVFETSLAAYCSARAHGDDSLVALPVFPLRAFLHGTIYVGQESALQDVTSLGGCRVGLGEAERDSAIWVRGILDDVIRGPGLDAIQWVPGSQEADLQSGSVDALVTDAPPSTPQSGARRLLADYQKAEEVYAAQEGVFPILHTVVIRRALHESYPWLASTLHKGFWQAKRASDRDMYVTNALVNTVPWMIPTLERGRAVLGDDPWPYGLKENRATLNSFLRYLHQQGCTETRLRTEDIFLAAQWTNSRRREIRSAHA